MTIASVLGVAGAGEGAGAGGETRGVVVTRVLATGARVHRQTRGVGPVHAVALHSIAVVTRIPCYVIQHHLLAGARVSALQVDARAVVQGAVVATWPAHAGALVHILAVRPVTLGTLLSACDGEVQASCPVQYEDGISAWPYQVASICIKCHRTSRRIIRTA